jgi:Uma2 family endonuclease
VFDGMVLGRHNGTTNNSCAGTASIKPQFDAAHQQAPILSVASYRAWLESRPSKERWELIGGVPMMMAPPNRRHPRIASNLESLLNAALKRHNPELSAYQAIGVNIVSTVLYDPEPNVVVVREDENPDPRCAERFYLVAEVLSEGDKRGIEGKRNIYRAHAYAIVFCSSSRTEWKSPLSFGMRMAGARKCCTAETN